MHSTTYRMENYVRYVLASYENVYSPPDIGVGAGAGGAGGVGVGRPY